MSLRHHLSPVGSVTAAVLALVLYGGYLRLYNDTEQRNSSVCISDLRTGQLVCRPRCDLGYFSLPGMKECHKWLDCSHFQDVTVKELIGHGAVKQVHRGQWRGHTVAVSTLRNDSLKDDFHHGLHMLQQFQTNDEVVQFIGSCDNSFLTEYHSLGSGENIESILHSSFYENYNTLKTRFKLCLSYIKAITFLHNSPHGTRVMCDSNDPIKAVSQFLVTNDLQLILNDLDALPEVNSDSGLKCKCGSREITGEFVAPEQLWPFGDVNFDNNLMPGYDEKTDIWKIPDVCSVLLGKGGNLLRFHLFEINAWCKEENSSMRPTAEEVLEVYKDKMKFL